MTLLEQYTLATSNDFIKKIAMCCIKASISVLGESCGGTDEPTNQEHSKRAIWARNTLENPRGMAERMALGVASGGIITAESTDADIEFTVNSLVSDFAGIE